MRDMEGVTSTCVSCFCRGGAVGPLPSCAGGLGWDFSREGARPGEGPRSSRHPHPPPLTSPGNCQSQTQLRTGLCVLGRSMGETARHGAGGAGGSRAREERKGDPEAEKGRAVTITLSSPPFNLKSLRQAEWKVWVELWPFSGTTTSRPLHQGGVTDLSGQPSQQQPPPQPQAAGVTLQVRLNHCDPALGFPSPGVSGREWADGCYPQAHSCPSRCHFPPLSWPTSALAPWTPFPGAFQIQQKHFFFPGKHN